MKSFNLFTLCVLCFLSLCMTEQPVPPHTAHFYRTISGGTSHIGEECDRIHFINAIIAVESGGDDSAVGDGGKAVGCLQIHPIMVKEVNRILKKEVYTLDDRKDRTKSIAMFRVYSSHYTPSWDGRHYELVARRWNGGPKGDKKNATLPYWKKVKALL